MKLRFWFVLAVAVLALAACGQEGVFSGKLIVGGEVVIQSGQTETSVIMLLEGDLVVEKDARLYGDVYQFGGNTSVGGVLFGDVYLFNGIFELAPTALVDGDILLGGGQAQIDPAGEVSGEVVESQTQLPSGERVDALGKQNLGWRVVQILLVGLAAYLFSHNFGRPLRRVADAVRFHAVPSAAMGFLVFVVGLSLLVQMAFTILLTSSS